MINPKNENITSLVQKVIQQDSCDNDYLSNIKNTNLSCNLLTNQVQDRLFILLRNNKYSLIDDLLETDKNESKANFNDPKFIQLVHSLVNSTSALRSSDDYISILDYLMQKEEFKKAITKELGTNILQSALKYNLTKIIKAFTQEPYLQIYFKNTECFEYACQYSNTELLDIYFKEESQYSNLSNNDLIKKCFEVSFNNKQYEVIYYLIESNKENINNEAVDVLCKKSQRFNDIVMGYKFYYNLDDKINNIKNKYNNKIKKKI